MSINGQKVQFKHYTRAAFTALGTKDENTFYVVVEPDGKRRLYLGNKLLTEGYLTSHQSLSGYATQTWVTNTAKAKSAGSADTAGHASTAGQASLATTATTATNATKLNNQEGSYYLSASNLTGTVPIARLGSSGTASSTTFLRGDGTWATPSYYTLSKAKIEAVLTGTISSHNHDGTYLTSHQAIKTLHSKTLTGSGNVTLTAADVGARSTSWTPAFADLPTGTGSSQVAVGNHTHSLSSTSITGTLPLTKGGTGATTATAARTALGLGDVATRNMGTTSGTVAHGDHDHYVSNSVSIGPSTSSSSYGVIIGQGAATTSTYGVAIGRGSSSGEYAVAIGSYTATAGNGSLASGSQSVSIGSRSSATATNSISIGYNTVNSTANSVQIGRASTAMTGYIGNKTIATEEYVDGLVGDIENVLDIILGV